MFQVNLYPRTSIDNARRVRQLAHATQGTLTVLAGKRIAALLPKAIGAWLSGVYDSDRLVARTAQDSISAAFNTDEKRRALWKIYKTPLVEYAEDAILTQTVQTLSDERSTTPDDAEAKFVRVVGNAIQMLAQVIKVNYGREKETDRSKFMTAIEAILKAKKLWEYSSHQDPSLRKAVCALVGVCANLTSEALDWEVLSACFVGKALHSTQLGSSRQFSEALLILTSSHPSIWTTDYTAKTAASKRLSQYLRKGSQRGPFDYWTDIKLLLPKIPISAWSTVSGDDTVALQAAQDLLESLKAGVNSSEEPRPNLQAAWSTYVDIAFWLVDLLEVQAESSLLEASVLPLVTQHIALDPQNNEWTVPVSFGASIASSVLTRTLSRGMHSLFDKIWTTLCQVLIDAMRLSLPESSKDFAQSQDGVIAQSERLARVKSLVLEARQLPSPEKDHALEVIQRSDVVLIRAAIDLLKNRNGKPYGAAAVLEATAVSTNSPPALLTEFLHSDALELLSSPSAGYMVSLSLHTGQDLSQIIRRLTTNPNTPNSSQALTRFLKSMTEADISQHPELESYILDQIPSKLEHESVRSMIGGVFFNADLEFSGLRKNCSQKLLDQLSPTTDAALQRSLLRFFIGLFENSKNVVLSDDLGSLLLTKLLILSESDEDEVSELASSLSTKLKKGSVGKHPAVAPSGLLVSEQLSGKGDALPVFVLVDLAKEVLKGAGSSQPDLAHSLLPGAARWQDCLRPYINARPPLSTSVTSPLRGLVYLVDDVRSVASAQVGDSEGFSPVFRLFLYTTKMLAETSLAEMQSDEQRKYLFSYYPLALQVVNEKLTMESANKAWENIADGTTETALEAVSQGNSLIQSWIPDDSLISLWSDALRSTETLDPRAYYTGLVFDDVLSRLADERGFAAVKSSFEAELKDLHRSKAVVCAAGLISVLRDYFNSAQPGRKLLNELVAAVTGMKPQLAAKTALVPLVLLDLLLGGNPEALDAIPSQRQNFLMQTLVRLLSGPLEDQTSQVLALKILDPLMVAIKDLYGDHWEQILQYLSAVLQRENDLNQDLPLLNAGCRLYGRLNGLAKSEDANEDLVDAWNTNRESLEAGLLCCLDNFRQSTNTLNQPRQVTAELLQRQLSQIPARYDANLYGLLASQDNAVQRAAYDLLHRSIPAMQEQVSFNLAIDKTTPHLAPELLNLLVDVPRFSTDSAMSARRGYLLSWSLVFDHFREASYKVQECYVADIKEGGTLGNLLDTICEVCRITSNKPVDASKVDVTVYDLGSAETDDREEQLLAMHLYYCCLLHTPGLVRSWFIEQKNRVKSPLESWTQRHFAPMLMSAAAATVTTWAQSQAQDENESPVTVKASLNGAETVASIAVDPESPPISLAISLPKSYPLESPSVSSRTRVGVSEKNWQSWLRTIQIIIFSTGSIIEGLVAFRRNVQGALKGQSECAICYSIIGTDMQTPNKRCGTCRNTFHGSCLFRWFRSSNSSSCPLCRNNFNYA
jgi:E3 ubiquitin-protein ligase listerin